MDELKKIDIDVYDSTSETKGESIRNHLTASGSGVGVKNMKKNRINYKILLLITAVLLLVPAVILVVLGFMLWPLNDVVKSMAPLAATAKSAAEAIKNQDLVKTKEDLTKLRQDLTSVKSKYSRVSGLKTVPLLGLYIKDGEHVIEAGFAGITAADKALEALEPNADLLGFKGGSRFVTGNADERIQTAVKTMKALTPNIKLIADQIEIMRRELNYIDPNRYPVKFRGIEIRNRMYEAKNMFESAAGLFVNAQPLLTELPSILGEPDTKRYLVLFQNDKELRPTGGFLTAYAMFRIEKGKLILEKSDDIYALDEALTKEYKATREILTFHKEVYKLNIRDSNLSPDFKESMLKFEDMYQYVSGREDIDGIIAVDTHVLVETLKILGSMNIYGREFSPDNDPRCNCPKAVYELEDYSTRPVNYVRTDRKDIIGVLLQELMKKALGVSPSQYWGRLFQMLLAEINQKHVLAYFREPEKQKAVENFNMAGRIMTASETAPLLKYEEGKGWDYLHINNSNMAGAKSNMFVTDKVTKDTTINSDGTITTKLIIDYKNQFPGSDCNLERGGLCLNAPLRNWLRIYVPLGSKLTDSKGTQSPKDLKPKGMDTYESLSKTVFEGFMIVNPLGTAKVELTYTSPVQLNANKYQLLYQKQPGTEGSEVILKLNGKDKKKFTLLNDTEYTE